jgi:hypothetical protein
MSSISLESAFAQVAQVALISCRIPWRYYMDTYIHMTCNAYSPAVHQQTHNSGVSYHQHIIVSYRQFGVCDNH